jgi:hypothetical protein
MILKRAAFAFAAVGALFVASACDDGSDASGYGYGYGPTYSPGRCGAYKTCGTCTPVYGCGWCSTGGSSGTCADGPEDCSTAPSGWTWDPEGCGNVEGGVSEGGRTIAEAGIGQPDAGSVDTTNDGGGGTDGSQSTDGASDDAAEAGN